MSDLGRGAWQPIDTAPKDGRNIQVVSKDWVVTAHWNSTLQCWMACSNHFEPMPANAQPTDWQPIPYPPEPVRQ